MDFSSLWHLKQGNVQQQNNSVLYYRTSYLPDGSSATKSNSGDSSLQIQREEKHTAGRVNHKPSTQDREIQASKKFCEWQKQSSPEKSTPTGYPIPNDTYTHTSNIIWTEEVVFIYLGIYRKRRKGEEMANKLSSQKN